MWVYIALCFIPLIAMFICIALLAKGFKVWKGLVACLLGLAAVIPIAIMQMFVGGLLSAKNLLGVLISAIIVNGLIEESIKMLFLFLLPSKNTRESLFFLYSMLSGMALGCCETLFYLISGFDSLGLRMITAVIIHIACGALDGLFVYGIKTKKLNFSPFFFSVMLHGIYNYFAGFGQNSLYFYLSFAVILFGIIECRVQYIKIRDSL
ncbi:MAG: PrsW family intramembrane metalloprotease [Treponema sp.]|nr:PrsW family intramembrane metalloprotease [Treponema sp.]